LGITSRIERYCQFGFRPAEFHLTIMLLQVARSISFVEGASDVSDTRRYMVGLATCVYYRKPKRPPIRLIIFPSLWHPRHRPAHKHTYCFPQSLRMSTTHRPAVPYLSTQKRGRSHLALRSCSTPKSVFPITPTRTPFLATNCLPEDINTLRHVNSGSSSLFVIEDPGDLILTDP
jgi:hypothetical protein